METEITTIKLNRKTKTRLDNLKEYKRETYEEILQKIFNILNVCKINPESAQSRLRAIDRTHKRRIPQKIKKKFKPRKKKLIKPLPTQQPNSE